ncbi:MAG: hypothetical protein JW876_01495 [Candidatus Krumholzibacteriota bacterium]|nr:hypothetical protein [Candidatus Krumholzibacteriota bacterium]
METATIDEVIATFSGHVAEHYPAPELFRKNLDAMIRDKAERAGQDGYLEALERNVVFLHDVIVEGEALLDELIEGQRRNERIEELLGGVERRAREAAPGRLNALDADTGDEEFAELRESRREGPGAWRDRLEFEYRHLMALRIFLFEFFNVLGAVLGSYELDGAGTGGGRRVMMHLEITAHYYLGNVTVDGEAGSS